MRFNKPQIGRIAREFWLKADPAHQRVLDIAKAVSNILPLRIIYLKGLTLETLDNWLKDRGIPNNQEISNKSLHGVIMIREGRGFIFVNADDSTIEQRFTIAHEVSHYFLDYQIPRENAMLKIGPEIEHVLNGKEPASDLQKVKALLKGISIQPYSHFIEKSGNGSFLSWINFNSENEADYLALELLAPRSVVIKNTVTNAKRLNYTQFVRKCQELLREQYQIPDDVAHQYATELAYSVTNGPSFLDKLGL